MPRSADSESLAPVSFGARLVPPPRNPSPFGPSATTRSLSRRLDLPATLRSPATPALCQCEGVASPGSTTAPSVSRQARHPRVAPLIAPRVPPRLARPTVGCSPSALAQLVRGAVTERGSGAPLAGVVLTLVDDEGRTVVAGLSDAGGAYELRAPRAGRFALLVKRIGVRPTRTAPFALAADEARREPIEVDASSPPGRGAVTERASCRQPKTATRGQVALWEDVRAALTASVLTAQRAESGRVTRFSRDVDAGSGRVVRDERRTSIETIGHLFRSLPRHGWPATATSCGAPTAAPTTTPRRRRPPLRGVPRRPLPARVGVGARRVQRLSAFSNARERSAPMSPASSGSTAPRPELRELSSPLHGAPPACRATPLAMGSAGACVSLGSPIGAGSSTAGASGCRARQPPGTARRRHTSRCTDAGRARQAASPPPRRRRLPRGRRLRGQSSAASPAHRQPGDRVTSGTALGNHRCGRGASLTRRAGGAAASGSPTRPSTHSGLVVASPLHSTCRPTAPNAR
ncbi:MAG: carboxypeptidase regulatory-like domain-containing protein [Gemmatimonadetes bacterium]|nr:carboxypeptidase regulatory-like domain-containing protein [Gemmatimonadota bacterium]